MDHSNSEIHKIANVGNGQATREPHERPFSEHPEASFVRHVEECEEFIALLMTKFMWATDRGLRTRPFLHSAA